MIKNELIEEWFSIIKASDIDGVQAKHLYEIAQIAYKKGVADGMNDYARKVEKVLDDIACMPTEIVADLYMIGHQAAAFRFERALKDG